MTNSYMVYGVLLAACTQTANLGFSIAEAQDPAREHLLWSEVGKQDQDLESRVVLLFRDVYKAYFAHDEAKQVELTESIRNLGPGAVPTLIRLANDREYRARPIAVSLLGKFGTSADSAMPMLRQIFLSSSDARLRLAAANAILSIRPVEGPEILLELVGGSRFGYRQIELAKILAEHPEADERSVGNALLTLLNDQDNGVRHAAANAFIDRKSQAELETAKQAALRMLTDPWGLVRSRGLDWLRLSDIQIDSPEIRTALRSALHDRFYETRWKAAAVALRLGVHTKVANEVFDQALLARHIGSDQKLVRIFGSALLPRLKSTLEGTAELSTKKHAIHLLGKCVPMHERLCHSWSTASASPD